MIKIVVVAWSNNHSTDPTTDGRPTSKLLVFVKFLPGQGDNGVTVLGRTEALEGVEVNL